MVGISFLPNPFEFAASSPANNPAASKRLDKPVDALGSTLEVDKAAASSRLNCGDAAGSSTPLGGTATAPGMARVPENRFVLDEAAFFAAINPARIASPIN